jgi:hypothetical protein
MTPGAAVSVSFASPSSYANLTDQSGVMPLE